MSMNSPKTPAASCAQRNRQILCSAESSTGVREEFRDASEGFIHQWEVGADVSWHEAGVAGGLPEQRSILYGSAIIVYLLGSDFLCLTVENLLYYRTSINKRKRKELSMNTSEAIHEGQHLNLTMPAEQTVQYEFKNTAGRLEMLNGGQTGDKAALL